MQSYLDAKYIIFSGRRFRTVEHSAAERPVVAVIDCFKKRLVRLEFSYN